MPFKSSKKRYDLIHDKIKINKKYDKGVKR